MSVYIFIFICMLFIENQILFVSFSLNLQVSPPATIYPCNGLMQELRCMRKVPSTLLLCNSYDLYLSFHCLPDKDLWHLYIKLFPLFSLPYPECLNNIITKFYPPLFSFLTAECFSNSCRLVQCPPQIYLNLIDFLEKPFKQLLFSHFILLEDAQQYTIKVAIISIL